MVHETPGPFWTDASDTNEKRREEMLSLRTSVEQLAMLTGLSRKTLVDYLVLRTNHLFSGNTRVISQTAWERERVELIDLRKTVSGQLIERAAIADLDERLGELAETYYEDIVSRNFPDLILRDKP